MSRDFKLSRGDINITNGKIATLEGVDKLEQQTAKLIMSSKGGPFHPNYGSDIFDLIGRYGQEEEFLVPLIQDTLEEALSFYQQIQLNQELEQEMTDDEIYFRLENLNVSRITPTSYLVKADMITRAGDDVSASLPIGAA